MKIYYDSLTGNIERFIHKLPVPATKISEGIIVEEDYVLITFTTGLGHIPQTTQDFLKTNGSYLKGIASSGNKNFGTYFAIAADDIAKTFNVPVISKFELSGTPTDVNNFLRGMRDIETHRTE